ncbi:hypothetical protein [Caldisericum sp.]|uniref:hypothetical protein n=1 Tax=Caldisericum sp. TaxID=2499687 RepID=UPI003D125DAF
MENNEINKIDNKKMEVWQKFCQTNKDMLPAISPEQIEEAVDFLMGIALGQIYQILAYDESKENQPNKYMELKIKSMNTLLKSKQVILQEKQYKDKFKSKEIVFPDEYKLGIETPKTNEQQD